jgi:hypothetical protein
MFLYLDESGDLGWNFVGPNTSSRYLTLAFMLIPAAKRHIPKRIVRKMYEKYGWNPSIERKASDLSHQQKLYFCGLVKDLKVFHPDIKFRSITVKKECVKIHIRRDANKLYNYMIKLCVLKKIRQMPEVIFVRDERSIKVESGNSLSDYLQTELWCALKSSTLLKCQSEDSSKNKNLMFVDYLANCIWRGYERADQALHDELKYCVQKSTLYFSSQVTPTIS